MHRILRNRDTTAGYADFTDHRSRITYHFLPSKAGLPRRSALAKAGVSWADCSAVRRPILTPIPLAFHRIFRYSLRMGVSKILDEIKSLPAEQRWEILQRTREMLGPEIPEGFKQGMEEIARGEVIELDEALQDLERPE